MNKFKYKVFLAPGERVLEYKQSLKELGYTGGLNGSTYAVKTYGDNSFMGLGSRLDGLYADYSFLEQGEDWQYDAALAIAAIQEEEGYHENEWVVFDGKSDGRQFTNGKLYQLGGKYWLKNKEGGFHIKKDDNEVANGYPDNESNGKSHKASSEEIIAFFKQKHSKMPESKSTTQKVVGYRIKKDGPGFKKGLELKERVDSKPEVNYRSWVIDSPSHRVKFPISVLEKETEWFEPIYEELVKVERLVIGGKDLTVVINSKGEIKARGLEIAISDLRRVYNWFTNPGNWKLADYPISYSQETRFIRVGCIEEDNLFSPAEIASVVAAYNRLNS